MSEQKTFTVTVDIVVRAESGPHAEEKVALLFACDAAHFVEQFYTYDETSEDWTDDYAHPESAGSPAEDDKTLIAGPVTDAERKHNADIVAEAVRLHGAERDADVVRFDLYRVTTLGEAVYTSPHELHNEVTIRLPAGYFGDGVEWPRAVAFAPFDITPRP
jgi:hypothetical protein